MSQQRHPRFPFLPVLLLVWLLAGASAAAGVQAASVTATPAAPASAPPLRILAVDEPPLAYSGERGHIDGLGAEFVRAVQSRLGDHTEIEMLPELRAMQTTEREPNVVLIGFSRTPEREQRFHWIAPLIRKPWVLYVRPDDTRKVGSVAELRQFGSIAVVLGDVRERWLRGQGLGNLVDTGSPGQSVRLLQTGRVEALFHEPQGVAWYCRTQGCGKLVPRAAWVARHSDVWVLMSKPGTPADTVRRWQQAAQSVRADGSWERMARRWSTRSRDEVGIESVWRQGLLEFCADRASCKP